MSGTFVTIGVPEEPVYVPAEEGVTKIGGVPKWLCGEPANFRDIRCASCRCQLAHILSCDCPVDDDHDRVLYLFVCPKCGRSARVFRQRRAAAPEPAAAAPEPAPAPRGGLFDSSDFARADAAPADLLAAFSAFAGAQQPQKAPPQPRKGKKANRPQKEIGRFPAYYIETFDEPEAALAPGMNVTVSGSADSGAGMLGEEDLPDYGITPELVEFNERMSRCPDQVLRYARFDAPLVPEKIDFSVPPCPLCGAERAFEVELLPTIIYTLEPDSPMDFGPILVYTCSKDCECSSCEEFCYVTPPI